jgi:hypothetical protein
MRVIVSASLLEILISNLSQCILGRHQLQLLMFRDFCLVEFGDDIFFKGDEVCGCHEKGLWRGMLWFLIRDLNVGKHGEMLVIECGEGEAMKMGGGGNQTIRESASVRWPVIAGK